MKKNQIHPPILLEAIIKANNWHKTSDLIISVRRFHKIIDYLKAEYEIDFGFVELLNFYERFHASRKLMIEEYELHIHKSMCEKIMAHLEWYNRMYDAAEQVAKIQEIIKKFR